MKVIGYTSPEAVEVVEALTPGVFGPSSLEIQLVADEENTVPLAVALPPVEGVSLTDGDGWWNDDGNIYTVPIDFPNWGARIEVHGHSIDEARALAFRVLDGLT